jgi:hypothetical protein
MTSQHLPSLSTILWHYIGMSGFVSWLSMDGYVNTTLYTAVTPARRGPGASVDIAPSDTLIRVSLVPDALGFGGTTLYPTSLWWPGDSLAYVISDFGETWTYPLKTGGFAVAAWIYPQYTGYHVFSPSPSLSPS